MRGVALLLSCLVASCAPDYGHSAFRCDTEHGCPDGQTCIVGRCRRAAPKGDIVCGNGTCDLTQQQCCINGPNPPACFAADLACPDISALCDGIEDCQDGDWCCADGDTIACDASCKTYACRDRDDCPPSAQNCCDATAQQWGVCSGTSCSER